MSDGYNLVLAFPDQSPSFAHGFTCGRIWQAMTEFPGRDVIETVDADTRPTIEAMAMAKGWAEVFEELGDGWLSVRLKSPTPDIQIPGFRDVDVRMTASEWHASCVTKLGGSLYFVYFSLARREDGTVREKLFSRRIETFCGKPVRAKVRHQLADLADAASEVILAAVA